MSGERQAGASLLLVMVLISVVGLIATATLAYARTSMTAAGALIGIGDAAYDIDGALKAAVNEIRLSTFQGTGPCTQLVFPGESDVGDVTVTCEPEPNTGGPAEPPLSVDFRAYSCPPESLPCPADAGPELPAPWSLEGTALVRYTDPDSTPTAGERMVSVQSWAIQR